MMIEVNAHVPSGVCTKVLKVIKNNKGRKIRISSNWLPLFEFETGSQVIERSLGKGMGYTIELADLPLFTGKQIYGRTYKHRKSNPFETVAETSRQSLLDDALPEDTERVHIEFSARLITIRPIKNLFAQRLEKLLKCDQLKVFNSCSSGVDAYACKSVGFKPEHLLEWRPSERRDKQRDLSETGALTALENIKYKNVFNVDIDSFDREYMMKKMENESVGLMTISLSCTELSNVKAGSLKDKSFADASSSLDMVYSGLNLVEAVQPVCVLLEQVAGFANSDLFKLWDLRLRKWGYKTQHIIADARDYGGLSSRRRLFHFASSLPDQFCFPSARERNTTDLWETFVKQYLPTLRDVTHSKSLQDGKACGRLREIKPGCTHFPTVLKAQSRVAKDSLVCSTENKLFWPSLPMIRGIMGIPSSFLTKSATSEIETEIIGQSIDFTQYSEILVNIKEHIQSFIDKHKIPDSTLLKYN